MSIAIEVRLTGIASAQQMTRALAGQVRAAAERALFQDAERTMEEIKTVPHVPVDTGTLRNTGHVQRGARVQAGDVAVLLGFGGPAAPYAASVHENPRAGKTGGLSPSGRPYRSWASVGGWKYLERPVTDNAQRTQTAVVNAMREVIARARR